MNSIHAAALLHFLVLSALLLGRETTGETSKSQDEAVAAIEKLGGKVVVDQSRPEKPVIGVDFGWNKRVTDRDLEVLKSFPHLRSVMLEKTNITDAGIEHLRSFSRLKSLNIAATSVTESVMEFIGGLPELESLNISKLPVSDEGLRQLRGLTELEYLNLGIIESITDAGLENLEGLTNLKELALIGQ